MKLRHLFDIHLAPALLCLGMMGSALPCCAGEPPPSSGFPATLPLRLDSGNGFTNSGSAIVPFIAVIGTLAATAFWLAKRKARMEKNHSTNGTRLQWLKWAISSPSSQNFRVQQSSRLSPKASLHLVHWNDQEWMLGCTDHVVTLISSRPLPTPVTALDKEDA